MKKDDTHSCFSKVIMHPSLFLRRFGTTSAQRFEPPSNSRAEVVHVHVDNNLFATGQQQPAFDTSDTSMRRTWSILMPAFSYEQETV